MGGTVAEASAVPALHGLTQHVRAGMPEYLLAVIAVKLVQLQLSVAL